MWELTTLNPAYWRFSRLVNGVRWYRHRRLDWDLYYYIVEQPTSDNRHLLESEGYEMRPGDFSASELQDPPESESFGDSPPTSAIHAEPAYARFLYRPVRHDDSGGRWREVTAYRHGNNQKTFQASTQAARRPAVRPGEANPGLKHESNVGRYVFHLTTLRNLYVNPKTDEPATGIAYVGLDPQYGGGKGGACETCIVLNDKAMLEGSKANSLGVVAVTTALSNLKMYGNQRHEFSREQFSKCRYTDDDLTGRESVVLRFPLTETHIERMEVDPQHPDDEFVQLIRGVPIGCHEIQALTGEGWVSLLLLRSVLPELLPSLVPRPGSSDPTLARPRLGLDRSSPASPRHARKWEDISPRERADTPESWERGKELAGRVRYALDPSATTATERDPATATGIVVSVTHYPDGSYVGTIDGDFGGSVCFTSRDFADPREATTAAEGQRVTFWFFHYCGRFYLPNEASIRLSS